MERSERIDAETLIRLGLRELSRHRPDLALAHLRAAVDATPAACADRLSRALYWLSVALFRLDRKELGVKSLASAQKLRRRGFARSAYLTRSNEYGMPRRPTPELDDFYAFASIQMAAYLARKRRVRFESHVEREAVTLLVAQAWKDLLRSGRLDGVECSAKLVIFRQVEPGFDGVGMAGTRAGGASGTMAAGTRIIRASFGSSGRCSCGSGLDSARCCRRTRGLSEQ